MRRIVLALLIVGVVLMGRTAAGRLLMVAGPGGSFAEVPPAVREITLAPNGGWTQIPDPKAYYHNGKTYLNWIDASSGANEIASYDHATRTLSTPTQLADLGGVDNHGSGSVLVRSSDSKIVAAYTAHIDTRVRVRISSNAEDVSSFAAEQVLNPGYGGAYTYATLVQLRGVANDPIYLFVRSIPNLSSEVGRLVYTTSTDGGATWGSWTVLFSGSSSPAYVPYWRIGTDWDTRIDVFTTDQAPDASTGLWHFYIDGTDGSLHGSDGTDLGAAPLEVADLTLVEDDAEGNLWSWGASWDGNPATVIMQENTSSDNRIKVARWTGSAWQVDQVIANVGGQLGINKYASGAAIDHSDPDTVYLARKIGSRFEMFRYTSPDGGTTWTGTQLTSGSSVDNVWAEVPHFAETGFRAMWLRGTYTNDTSFSFGISAAR